MQDAVIAASPHVKTQPRTFTKPRAKTQLFDFLRSNINTLITSILNPSLKIPLKNLAPPPPPPYSILSLPCSNTSSYLWLDDSQTRQDDTEDGARNIKHDIPYHSRCQNTAGNCNGMFLQLVLVTFLETVNVLPEKKKHLPHPAKVDDMQLPHLLDINTPEEAGKSFILLY